MSNTATILVGDVRKRLAELPDQSVQCCITSPPYYGLRDYGEDGQIGLEESPREFVDALVETFREVHRVLRDDGTLWLNLGDSYYNYRPGKGQAMVQQTLANTKQDLPDSCPRRANKLDGFKEKELLGIPWRVAFALQDDGWYLRQDIIWAKPNPMPESVKDRCTKSHEHLFLLTKAPTYYFNHEAIKEPATRPKGNPRQFGASNQVGTFRNDEGRMFVDDGTRNKRDVWFIPTKPYKGAHFAVMPEALVEPCVLASTNPQGPPNTVLDPFTGSGTVAVVALRNGCDFIGTELSADYAKIATNRIEEDQPLFNTVIVK